MYDGVPMMAPARVWVSSSPSSSTRWTYEASPPGAAVSGLAHHLGDAPVQEDGLAVGAEHHVLGLQVAVQDAVAVRVGDRLAEREEDLEQLELLNVACAAVGPGVVVLDDLLQGAAL